MICPSLGPFQLKRKKRKNLKFCILFLTRSTSISPPKKKQKMGDKDEFSSIPGRKVWDV